MTDIESRIDQLLASVEEKDKIKHDSPVAKPETKDVVIPSRR